MNKARIVTTSLGITLIGALALVTSCAPKKTAGQTATAVSHKTAAETTSSAVPDFIKLENLIDNNKTYADLITEWKTTNESEGYTTYCALYDIDGNGIKELILRKENDYDDVIEYIYSIKDSKPINVFGYSGNGEPIGVPWSRYGSSVILNNGLIDSTYGDYSIYKIADDGYTAIMIAKAEPYDYPDEASKAEAKWRYFIGDKWVDDYGIYAKYLDKQGYVRDGNTEANIDWLKLQ
jgi:hypothetical protein